MSAPQNLGDRLATYLADQQESDRGRDVEAYLGEPRGRANGHRAPQACAPYPVQRLDQAGAQPRPAIVQGLGFDEGAVVTIGGQPNAGKTALAVSLGIAVATRAERWLGQRVRGGAVVYFAPEAPASVLMRARAALRIADTAGAQRAPFYLVEAVPALGGEETQTADTERMIATVEQVATLEGDRVGLAFCDTLASCLGGADENGDGMLRLVDSAKRIAARTSACLVLLHHPSKGDTGGLRGHGSLHAACDAVLRVETDELTGVRTATLIKARDHATGLQLRFELEPVALPDRDSFGDPRTTVVVRQSTKAVPRARPGGQRQQQLLEELERRHRAGERQWDEAAITKAGRDLGMHRNSPRDALKALIKSGYLSGSPSALSLKHPPEADS